MIPHWLPTCWHHHLCLLECSAKVQMPAVPVPQHVQIRFDSKATQVFKPAIRDGFAVWGDKKQSWEQLAKKNFLAQLSFSVYKNSQCWDKKCLDRHQVDTSTNLEGAAVFAVKNLLRRPWDLPKTWGWRMTVLSWDVKGKQGSLLYCMLVIHVWTESNHNICLQ